MFVVGHFFKPATESEFNVYLLSIWDQDFEIRMVSVFGDTAKSYTLNGEIVAICIVVTFDTTQNLYYLKEAVTNEEREVATSTQ